MRTAFLAPLAGRDAMGRRRGTVPSLLPRQPMERPMQRNDLSRSLVAFEQNSTLVSVVELSFKTWLVAGLVPGLKRQPLKKQGADADALLALLHRWRAEAVKAGGKIERIVVAFEAGRDGFWLARWLRARGIEAYVIHATSIPVSREHRRAKSDRLDTELLMRAVLGWLRGEAKHCSTVAIPTLAQEDARRQDGAHPMLLMLAKVLGIGLETADMLVHEVLSRELRDEKAVGRYGGMTGAPDESGSKRREKGLARAGNARVRRGMIQLAWRWLMFQKDSALTQWYLARTAGAGPAVRKTMIVALARQLLIALWRYVSAGVMPAGARRRAAGCTKFW